MFLKHISFFLEPSLHHGAQSLFQQSVLWLDPTLSSSSQIIHIQSASLRLDILGFLRSAGGKGMKDSAPDIKALTVLWVKILEFNVVSFKKKDLHRILLVQGSN